MRTMCHANKFVKEAYMARDLDVCRPAYSNLFNKYSALFAHVFDGIVWHCTSGDVLYICLSKECFRILLCMMM